MVINADFYNYKIALNINITPVNTYLQGFLFFDTGLSLLPNIQLPIIAVSGKLFKSNFLLL